MQSTRLIAIAVAGRQQPLAVLAKPSVPESVTRLRRRPRMVAGQIPLREGEAVPTTVTRVALLRREGRPVVEDGAVPTEQLAGRHVLAEPRRELHLEGAHVHAEDRGQRDAHLQALQLRRRLPRARRLRRLRRRRRTAAARHLAAVGEGGKNEAKATKSSQ